MKKLLSEPYMALGIIEPLSILPYFRLYHYELDTIVDLPCCAWHFYGRYNANGVVTLECNTERLPSYTNGTWSENGYYFLRADETRIQIIDLYGNISILSHADAQRLIVAGKVFNVIADNSDKYIKGTVRSFSIGDTCYKLILRPVAQSKICTLDAMKSLNDFIMLRAKMLGTNIQGISWESWDSFGVRLVHEMCPSNDNTFHMPPGITQVNLHGIKPFPREMIIENPMFRFDTNDYRYTLDSLQILDAYSVIIQSPLLCDFLKIRTMFAKIRLDNVYCSKLMLWGTRLPLYKVYSAKLYLFGNCVKELVLYNVEICSTDNVELNSDTRVILCNCTFGDRRARDIIMPLATVISEQEMQGLWNLPPSILSNRLCIPGV